MSFSGYLLKGEQDSFYYLSQSRLHLQRMQVADGTTHPTPCTEPARDRAQNEEVMLESEAEVHCQVRHLSH